MRVNDEKVDPKVRETWKMRWVPIDEVVRDIHIRDAREEGKGAGEAKKAFEVARKTLAEGLSADIIKKCTGLDKEDILALG
ncbi:hypothetical protein FACS1894187_02210 [Synergistales bacterium]|nr:hypothetical protein FACS1894187_02210 [Synergistales bacterium]